MPGIAFLAGLGRSARKSFGVLRQEFEPKPGVAEKADSDGQIVLLLADWQRQTDEDRPNPALTCRMALLRCYLSQVIQKKMFASALLPIGRPRRRMARCLQT
jgi:hypothetical protein